MDKQLIERIALEVADSITAPFINDESMARFAHAFLARIDAERGKSATAWLHDITHNDDPRQHDEALAFTPDAFPMDGCGLFTSVGSRPLFLFPMIPEGWMPDGDEQIPTCISKAGTAKLKSLGIDVTYYEIDEAFRAMLAAAQGERNAD